MKDSNLIPRPSEGSADGDCSVTPKREMSMMTWIATEGGRKCPACGRYAKADELGYTGGWLKTGAAVIHVSSYGHLKGFGCNRSQNAIAVAPPTQDSNEENK